MQFWICCEILNNLFSEFIYKNVTIKNKNLRYETF